MLMRLSECGPILMCWRCLYQLIKTDETRRLHSNTWEVGREIFRRGTVALHQTQREDLVDKSRRLQHGRSQSWQDTRQLRRRKLTTVDCLVNRCPGVRVHKGRAEGGVRNRGCGVRSKKCPGGGRGQVKRLLVRSTRTHTDGNYFRTNDIKWEAAEIRAK